VRRRARQRENSEPSNLNTLSVAERARCPTWGGATWGSIGLASLPHHRSARQSEHTLSTRRSKFTPTSLPSRTIRLPWTQECSTRVRA